MTIMVVAEIGTLLDWIGTFLDTPWMVFATLNVLMFIGWGLTLRRYSELVHQHAEATAWWMWWVEQAVRHGYEPGEDERNAADELLPDEPGIDRQLEAVRNHLNAERGDPDG